MRAIYEASFYSVYFAPRGAERLLTLGDELAGRHLNHRDRLIGIVGDAGSGKSSIIKGMFPGLSLTNDDDVINPLRLMQIKTNLDNDYTQTTYHIDMRFQMAFTQMFDIVQFVKGALDKKRRVIIEHFDLIYPYLNLNADLLVGIGAEIIVTRPTIFGPLPSDIYKIVFESVKIRKMIHTSEDLLLHIINVEYKNTLKYTFEDVRGGFVLRFKEKPDFEISTLQERVLHYISKNIDVSYYDETHIKIGDFIEYCTGPRIHVKNTKYIDNFRLIQEFIEDKGDFLLVGLCGKDKDRKDINKIYVEANE
ncbi:MAG: alanine-tRNA synthetase second additional domain-containing protein [Lachnospirales bacterium]